MLYRVIAQDGNAAGVMSDMLMEVSCSAQSKVAHVMSTKGTLEPKVITADMTNVIDHTTLCASICKARMQACPLLIQSNTRDLPKVVFALYKVSACGQCFFVSDLKLTSRKSTLFCCPESLAQPKFRA